MEYHVRGFDESTEWRRAWKELESVELYGLAFGEWDAVLSGYELRIQGLGQLPSEAIEEEFLTSDNVVSAYIEMTLFDLHMPRDERRVSWSRKSLRRHGLVRE